MKVSRDAGLQEQSRILLQVPQHRRYSVQCEHEGTRPFFRDGVLEQSLLRLEVKMEHKDVVAPVVLEGAQQTALEGVCALLGLGQFTPLSQIRLEDVSRIHQVAQFAMTAQLRVDCIAPRHETLVQAIELCALRLGKSPLRQRPPATNRALGHCELRRSSLCGSTQRTCICDTLVWVVASQGVGKGFQHAVRRLVLCLCWVPALGVTENVQEEHLPKPPRQFCLVIARRRYPQPQLEPENLEKETKRRQFVVLIGVKLSRRVTLAMRDAEGSEHTGHDANDLHRQDLAAL
mmetsp:Transcript_115926/g.328046  ORF Transcript_115926/g.328046 Transcript_115926/m.328046 type:complete len:290 (-) Transcript_115926:194-1063(-)